MNSHLPSAEALRAWFDYVPGTGALFWKEARGTARKGDPAGHLNGTGYLHVGLAGRKLRVNRIVWAMHHGSWPSGEVDHIDGDPLNNRIENLRDVTHGVNMMNRRRPRADSSVGVLGVERHHDKFRVRIRVDGKQLTVGRFDTVEEAGAAYLQAQRSRNAQHV